MVRIMDIRNAYRILLGKPHGNPNRMSVDNVKNES
jgi:hypothetical protein